MQFNFMKRKALPALALLVVSLAGGSPQAAGRPLLVTVDDLPMSYGSHEDEASRRRITEGLLAALDEHGIRAVGMVTWSNVRTEGDLRLLDLWLEAGHELGNHSNRHLDYSRTATDDYIDDIEEARRSIAGYLEGHGRKNRFFRFPYLREGDTPEKLQAMRDYLVASGQRNLPVTIDNQDWSYERPWIEARSSGDLRKMERVKRDYLAGLRISVRHHERTGDALFDRPLPQILLLHANEIGSVAWDGLFEELSVDHRFATVDEVISDPVFGIEYDYVAPRGPGLWDRLLASRQVDEAKAEVEAALLLQVEAWNRGDLDAFCEIYATDAAFVSPSGLTFGRSQVLERYRNRYPDRAAMGRLSLEFIEARPAAGIEVSMLGDARPSRVHGMSVVARWRLQYPDKEPSEGLTLIILRRRGEGWEIVQDASM